MAPTKRRVSAIGRMLPSGITGHPRAACRSPDQYLDAAGLRSVAVALMSPQNWMPDDGYHIIPQLKRSVGCGHSHDYMSIECKQTSGKLSVQYARYVRVRVRATAKIYQARPSCLACRVLRFKCQKIEQGTPCLGATDAPVTGSQPLALDHDSYIRIRSERTEREDEEECTTHAVNPGVPVQRGAIVRKQNG